MPALAWICTFLAVWLGLSLVAGNATGLDPLAVVSAVALALIAVVLVYHRRQEHELLAMLKRGGVVLLPILLVMLLPISLLLFSDSLDVRLRQAGFAGLMIAGGWLASFIFQEERKQRDRHGQELDLLLALRSEIFTVVEKLDKRPITQDAVRVQQKIVLGGDDALTAYFPFSATESPATVYDAVSGQLHVIAAEALEPVLRFYAAYSELTAIVEDTHRDSYGKLNARRRVNLHRELTQQRRATLYWGLRALAAINLRIGVQQPEDLPRSGYNVDLVL